MKMFVRQEKNIIVRVITNVVHRLENSEPELRAQARNTYCLSLSASKLNNYI
jgi:hypothetical protein